MEVVEGDAGYPSLEGYRLRVHLVQLAQEINVFYVKSCTFSTFRVLDAYDRKILLLC